MFTNGNSLAEKQSVPVLVRVREVAKLLSVSRHTVHALIEHGDLEASEVSPSEKRKERRHVRVTRKSLLRFYQKRFGHHLKQALANPFDA